ncbi:hypothetical protein [Streptomyces niveus]|uniref:hypothetical protein n=1 Tax=Streptomyces niveus TaxID=193462 RepID=UPI003421983B
MTDIVSGPFPKPRRRGVPIAVDSQPEVSGQGLSARRRLTVGGEGACRDRIREGWTHGLLFRILCSSDALRMLWRRQSDQMWPPCGPPDKQEPFLVAIGSANAEGLPPVVRLALSASRASLAVTLLVGALSACGSSDDPAVSGLRDDLRHTPQKTVIDTRPRIVEKCTTGTKRVRHTSTTGAGSKRTTRTWYTEEPTRTCKKVRRGTESFTRVVRQERWCVELDNVDGTASNDDVWFEVDVDTYAAAVKAEATERISFTPLREGC